MTGRAKRFFEGIKDKQVVVVGIGVTNTDVVKLLLRQGCRVSVHDRRERGEIGAVCEELEALGARLVLGEQYLERISCDVLFRTPGMYYLSDFLAEKRRQGVVVTSEMEVFFDLCPCRTFAITGSDGKTTTSTLIGEMLSEQGYTVHLGGNIGRALLPIIEDISEDDMAVVELSSFQLISMRPAPDVSVVTNVAPNHLDVHRDMAEYIEAKRNIFLHQGAFSKTVLNMDNEITRSFSDCVRGRAAYFSRERKTMSGAYLADDNNIYLATRDGDIQVMSRADIALPGVHNVENYLAACAAVSDFVKPETMKKVAGAFLGVEHRIEFVRERGGVRWYNDSIATSPTRTIAGLRSFPERIVIIAGGYDKKIPFLPLAPEINRHVKLLILTGPTADKIEEAVVSHPSYDKNSLAILRAADLQDAVLKAAAATSAGDVVSLSPACASFDSYPNFEARGRHFKQLVNSL